MIIGKLRRVGDCARGDALGDLGPVVMAMGEALGDRLKNIGKRRRVGAKAGAAAGAATGASTGAATGAVTGASMGASTGGFWALTSAKKAKIATTKKRENIIMLIGFGCGL